MAEVVCVGGPLDGKRLDLDDRLLGRGHGHYVNLSLYQEVKAAVDLKEPVSDFLSSANYRINVIPVAHPTRYGRVDVVFLSYGDVDYLEAVQALVENYKRVAQEGGRGD